jgi:K+-sensing histidine kinase KdpD
VGVAYLFYRNKLKKPLQILATAADKIGENDLNIEIQYSVKDEMGELCNSFEIMRKQLIANNQKMWDVMEEQRRLNAAFAHDLRTPLTVLRGYTDFLKEYIPQGKISEEKLSSSLSLLSDNLTRLERYCNTMKEINSLDEIPLHKTLTDTVAFYQKLEDIITVMDGSNGIHIKLNSISLPKEELSVDEAIVMEVLENLMSNALRFAKTTVTVSLTIEEEAKLLLVSVKDDGKGFSTKDLNMATKAYYKDETEKNSCHFGIGLYICTILCEKHGGCISLSNSMNRGAVVTASFSIGTDI